MADIDTLRELAGKLRIKSGMMKMGERIAWGSDTELMDAAEAGILALLDENERLRAMLTEFGTSRVRDRVAERVGCNHDILHDALRIEVHKALAALSAHP